MKRFRVLPLRPHGQALVATLLFCFVFAALFAALYRAGTLYQAKARTARGADLSVLSGGAVYCDGLQWVRYANVVLVFAIAVDLVKMAVAAASAGALTGGAAAVEAAWTADKLNLRSRIQTIVRPIFGIEYPTGLFPFLILYETRQAARSNHLSTSFGTGAASLVPAPPVLLFNVKTAGIQGAAPGMNLRFRTLQDLLDDLGDVLDEEPLYYSYSRGLTFTSSQVEPCRNTPHPGQKCVKKGTPKYGGLYCEVVPDGGAGLHQDLPVVKSMMARAKWALNILAKILSGVKLDITHGTKPPDHTLLFYDFSASGSVRVHQTAEALVEGPGLCAWDLTAGPFRTRLVSEEFDQLPLIGPLLQKCPGGLPGGIPSFPNLTHAGGGFVTQ